MPNYNFRSKDTGETWTSFMSIEEKDQYLNNNPNIEQTISPVAFGDPIKMGVRKPDSGFRDVLRGIKKHHPRGRGINTF